MNKNANIYVCGNSKTVGPGVYYELLDTFYKEGKYSPEEAEALATNLRQQSRYQEDVF
jgi:sulfite reductase alpha subunit-like flavoprotein